MLTLLGEGFLAGVGFFLTGSSSLSSSCPHPKTRITGAEVPVRCPAICDKDRETDPKSGPGIGLFQVLSCSFFARQRMKGRTACIDHAERTLAEKDICRALSRHKRVFNAHTLSWYYLTVRVCKVVLQMSIPAQIRQLILYISDYKG